MANKYATVLRRNLSGALGRGDCAASAELLEKLREEAPLAIETRGLQLEHLVRCGSAADGRRLSRQLLELYPASPRVLFWSGRAAYRDQAYHEAEELFRESGRIARYWGSERWLGKTLTQAGAFDEAQALLVRLARDHPSCLTDLAWLHERKGDCDRALRCIEDYLAEHPENEYAQQQRLRLKARTMETHELLCEVEELDGLGEDIPQELLPEYVDRLLRSGQGERARELVQKELPRLTQRTLRDLAWTVHRLQLYDLSLELFLEVLPGQCTNLKLLAALEKAARSCQRVGEVIAAYECNAPEAGNLYGRMVRLRKGLGQERSRETSASDRKRSS